MKKNYDGKRKGVQQRTPSFVFFLFFFFFFKRLFVFPYNPTPPYFSTSKPDNFFFFVVIVVVFPNPFLFNASPLPFMKKELMVSTQPNPTQLFAFTSTNVLFHQPSHKRVHKRSKGGPENDFTKKEKKATTRISK